MRVSLAVWFDPLARARSIHKKKENETGTQKQAQEQVQGAHRKPAFSVVCCLYPVVLARIHKPGLIHSVFLKSTSFCLGVSLIIIISWVSYACHTDSSYWAFVHGDTCLTLNILFLCTGNSCRSQMAEGWTRALGGAAFHATSAGIEAHGKNPRAIAVMSEAGVDISGQESTIVSEKMLQQADLVVTVCGHADEQCPVLPPGLEKVHWPLADPAKATGTEEEIMASFRATRDEVRSRVQGLLDRLIEEGSN